MSEVKFTVKNVYTRRMSELLRKLRSPQMRIKVNEIIESEIRPYVPSKSGALQKSKVITPNTIIWGEGLPYAKYQFYGQVYKKNYPITKNGRIVGWYSKGPKYNSGQELGGHMREMLKGWTFGYSSLSATHHWTKIYEWKLKRETNLKITRMLKAECKKEGK